MQAMSFLVFDAGRAGNTGDDFIGRHIAAQVYTVFVEYRGGAADAQGLRHAVLVCTRSSARHHLL